MYHSSKLKVDAPKEIPVIELGYDYSGLSINELETVNDAFNIVKEGLVGVLNRPRCMINPHTKENNFAGYLLESFLESIDNEAALLIQELANRKHISPEDYRTRFNMLVSYEIYCGTEPAGIVKFAATTFSNQIASVTEAVQ